MKSAPGHALCSCIMKELPATLPAAEVDIEKFFLDRRVGLSAARHRRKSESPPMLDMNAFTARASPASSLKGGHDEQQVHAWQEAETSAMPKPDRGLRVGSHVSAPTLRSERAVRLPSPEK